MMRNYEDAFKTADLALATTLSLHFPIISIDRTTPKKVLFVFDRTNELNQVVEQFWHGKISVEPQSFANQIKNLKNRLYSGE